jgi:hypothetical protein
MVKEVHLFVPSVRAARAIITRGMKRHFSSVVLCYYSVIVIYEPSAGRRCSRMSAFFKARATKEQVPLINARMNGRCLHASGSYNIFCTKIKLIFFCFNTLNINEHKTK